MFFSADSNFFSVFNVDLISGNRENALDAPKSAVINQSIAQKYFGESNPIGKEIEWSHQQGIDFYTYTVKGVMPDFPKNSHFHPEILLSFDDPLEYNQWFYTYLLLKENTDVKDVKAQFQAFRNLHLNEMETSDQLVFHLQNVADIHLYSHKDREIEPNGDARSILVLSIVGFILLVVISLNYMNFQIASVLERNTFFNVSKILGAKRREFIVLLALESSLLVFISSVISLMVYIGILPLLANWLQIGLLLSVSEVVVVYFLVLLFFIFSGNSMQYLPCFPSTI